MIRAEKRGGLSRETRLDAVMLGALHNESATILGGPSRGGPSLRLLFPPPLSSSAKLSGLGERCSTNPILSRPHESGKRLVRCRSPTGHFWCCSHAAQAESRCASTVASTALRRLPKRDLGIRSNIPCQPIQIATTAPHGQLTHEHAERRQSSPS